ncbi:hypothetical protein KUCAC02_018409, partial [Chaenocephalus aceratus]
MPCIKGGPALCHHASRGVGGDQKVCILVKKEELALESLKQFYINVEQEEWKLDTLCDLYENLTITQGVIFLNTRRKVDWLRRCTLETSLSLLCMVMWTKGAVLITTDLLARGIDVQTTSI